MDIPDKFRTSRIKLIFSPVLKNTMIQKIYLASVLRFTIAFGMHQGLDKRFALQFGVYLESIWKSGHQLKLRLSALNHRFTFHRGGNFGHKNVCGLKRSCISLYNVSVLALERHWCAGALESESDPGLFGWNTFTVIGLHL